MLCPLRTAVRSSARAVGWWPKSGNGFGCRPFAPWRLGVELNVVPASSRGNVRCPPRFELEGPFRDRVSGPNVRRDVRSVSQSVRRMVSVGVAKLTLACHRLESPLMAYSETGYYDAIIERQIRAGRATSKTGVALASVQPLDCVLSGAGDGRNLPGALRGARSIFLKKKEETT